MRHLKKFNESATNSFFTQEQVDDIKDVFQDLIDEFNIIKDPDNTNSEQQIDGEIFIGFSMCGSNHRFVKDNAIEILVEIYASSDYSLNKNFHLIKPHVTNIISRLRLMNYSANIVDKNNGFISISIKKV